MDVYKSVKISFGTVMENVIISKFAPDHLITKKVCKHAVKKLPFEIRYVPDWYKTQKICDKAILNCEEFSASIFYVFLKNKKETDVYVKNVETLESVPDFYKNQQMCDKAVDNYLHALKFVPNCCITQKIYEKAVNIYHFITQFVSDCYKTQEMCDKPVNRCFLPFF